MVSGDESGDRRPVKRMKTNDGGDGEQQQTDLVTAIQNTGEPLEQAVGDVLPGSHTGEPLEQAVGDVLPLSQGEQQQTDLVIAIQPQEQAVGDAGPEIFAGDIVKNKRTNEIGVVSADLRHFLPVARNTEEDLTVQEVIVVGRDFKHGKAVSSATERTKIGMVISVKKWVDLALSDGDSTGAVAHSDIEAVNLERTQSLYNGDVVVSDDWNWVGVVEDTELRVKVKANNGMEPVKLSPDPKEEDGFEPIYANRMEESISRPYFVGQKINCFVFDDPRFKYVDGEKMGGHVIEQDLQYVHVNWLMAGSPGLDEQYIVNTPTKLKLLKKISGFAEAEWVIGERCLYEGQVYLVVNLRTTITVKWQDGTSSEVDGLDVVPLDNAEDLFFCGQMVNKKAEVGDDAGVVLSVTGDQVSVEWLLEKQGMVESVNKEDLELVPTRQLNPGDNVIRKNHSPFYGMVKGILDHGNVEVAWVDDSVSMVGIFGIQRILAGFDDGEADMDEDEHDNASHASDHSDGGASEQSDGGVDDE
ncbi:putative ubiquitin-conjugating enzyme E2 23 [Orobanche hederae]